ncbi:SOS response-associated peptidase [Brachybacterium halotolerans subsp. kimchii]|uniref:SOS response-associated peptidase n=1 Tax=Brachybacterium halotolerans TaxID=2795215 RepID=UPI001E3F87FD|nr:SOS response-associated peptidase [Brachybacterium halotolerans]UEJ82777.1 SOS response-associated peptidase [Brachybacterium halotolerans subsp. kimchii]
MCGRFVLDFDEAGLLRAYVATKADQEGRDWSPVYSIAPSTLVPVVREHYDDEGELQRTLEPARWGLRAAWAKEKGPRPINARYETVTTNGMFRSSFTSQRVVVPMNGYYEWVEQDDGSKQPYYVHPEHGGLLNAAGLAAARKSEDGESWDVTFTIITREAKDAAGEVHDRMPAYLPDDMLDEWLAPGKLGDDEKADLHTGLGEVSEEIAKTLVTYPVDRQVNNARRVDRTDPSLIEPVALT